MFRILHVENSHFFKTKMEDINQQLGNTTYSVSSLTEAMDVLENDKIDIIITGMELRDSLGTDLIHEINRSKFQDIPIIVLTSTDSLELRETLFEMGVVDYILKSDMTMEKFKNYFEFLKSNERNDSKYDQMSIAVLDDSKLSLALIRNILNINGFQKADYFHEPQALLQSDKVYDIYLLDLVMPDMTGEEVVMRLREKNSRSIIILVSGIKNYKTISSILLLGADDYIMKPYDAFILVSKIKSNIKTYLLKHEVEDKKELLRKSLTIDNLTGIYNRNYLIETIQVRRDVLQEPHQDFLVMLFNINDFSQLNQKVGYLVGDEILQKIAKLHKEEAGEGSIVGRYHADQFIIVNENNTLDQGKRLARNIKDAIESINFGIDNEIYVSLSCGIGKYNDQLTKHILLEVELFAQLAKENKQDIFSVEEYKTMSKV